MLTEPGSLKVLAMDNSKPRKASGSRNEDKAKQNKTENNEKTPLSSQKKTILEDFLLGGMGG